MLVVFGFLIYLPGLYTETGITSKDEYLLTLRTPMEMVERGEYATPYLDSVPRLKKPPLLYWLISANYKLFGINLLSARVWGVFFAIGMSVLTMLIYRELFEEDESPVMRGAGIGLQGLVPALLVLTSAGASIQARLALLDLPLAFFVTCSVYFFLLWKGAGRSRYLYLGAVACALSAMTKGPVGPGVAVLAALLSFFILGGWGELRRRWTDVAISILIFFAVVLPWPIAMYLKWGELFTGELFNELVSARFMSSYSTGPEVVIGGLMLLLLPWSFLYVRAFLSMFLHGLEPRYTRQLWLLGWTLAALLPFLLLKVKFERYVIVALPPAVMMLCSVPYKSSLWKGVAHRACALFYTALGLFFISFGYWFKLMNGAVLALLVFFVGLFFFYMWRAGGKEREKSFLVAVVMAGLFNMALFGLLYPGFGIQRTPPELLYVLKQRPAEVFYYKGDNPGMLSIRLKRSVQKVITPADLKEGADKGIYLIVENRLVSDLKYVAMLAGVTVHEPLLRFETFYSRRSWIKFAREGADKDDWRMAYKDRSLDGLKTGFGLYFISSSSTAIRSGWRLF
jgi:4-amino-4-deoxy-L-arabinose transferase-like glycosyltransferase